MRITLPNLSCPVYKFTCSPEDRCICLVFLHEAVECPLKHGRTSERGMLKHNGGLLTSNLKF